MRRLISIAIAAALLSALPFARADAQTPGSVEVVGTVSNIPCARNSKEFCPDILILPRARIDVYRLGGERVATVEIPEESDTKSSSDFSLHLAPNHYLFDIQNELNKQEAIFGPVDLTGGIKKIDVHFTLYDSIPEPKVPQFEREICYQQTILALSDPSSGPALNFALEMECIASLTDALIPASPPTKAPAPVPIPPR